jgi:hypothetical protein
VCQLTASKRLGNCRIKGKKIKKLIMMTGLLCMATSAFAESGWIDVSPSRGGAGIRLEITGDAAAALYDSLTSIRADEQNIRGADFSVKRGDEITCFRRDSHMGEDLRRRRGPGGPRFRPGPGMISVPTVERYEYRCMTQMGRDGNVERRIAFDWFSRG